MLKRLFSIELSLFLGQKPFDYIVFLLALILSYFDIMSSVLIVLISAVAGILITISKKDVKNGGGQ